MFQSVLIDIHGFLPDCDSLLPIPGQPVATALGKALNDAAH